jgi:beta-glucanase (GH16 family)
MIQALKARAHRTGTPTPRPSPYWLAAAATLTIAATLAPARAATMTFNEEFTNFVASPDGSAGWMTTYPYGGESARTLPANDEWEYYSDSSVGVNPFTNTLGKLVIAAAPAAPGSNPYNLPYTSGLITTYTSFQQLYGRFEMRAKLPAGQGLWPAFWMLPANNDYSAELDIFEVLEQSPTTLYATTHGETGSNWVVNCQQLTVPDTASRFHVYGVDWGPKTTTFYMDDKVIATSATPASMNTPMYILINLAIGGPGSWPGAPNAATTFPAKMVIDWVRAYQTPATLEVGGPAALVQLPR